MTPKAVIFDMDGTLLDTERVYQVAFVETGLRHGLADLAPTFLNVIGRSGVTQESVISQALGDHVTFERFSDDWGKAIEEKLSHAIPVKEGALELCQRLADIGYHMAVATSTSTGRAKLNLTRAGLAQFFSHIVGGDQVANRKPDPEPYLKVASLLAVPPEHCVMFEDSDPGTISAVRAGGIVVQVPDLKEPSPDVIASGHLIAPNLMAGARQIGLI